MELIKKYFPNLTDLQVEQLEKLQPLYEEWNQKINVISRKDINHLYERHVLHSLSIAKICQFKNRTKILDAGTGGGFPGIPLAIIFPECHFTLADSIGKKIRVVQSVSGSLSLPNVEAIHQRIEKIKDKYDFVVSRAVTAFPAFLNMTRDKIKQKNFNSLPNGIIYLKGGDIKEEIQSYKNTVIIYHVQDYFEESFFETKKIVYLPVYPKK